MITYLEGDLFSSPAQTLVNTVNTVGVMGKGIALEFRKRYPAMYKQYKEYCDHGSLTVGKLMLWRDEPDHWLLMFPTKTTWRKPSDLSYIDAGLKKFADTYTDKGITSAAFPRLGCGNGGLDWKDVKPLMEKYLEPLSIPCYVYLKKLGFTSEEHHDIAGTEIWMRRNAADMSYSAVKEDIIEHCSRLSYQFTCNNELFSGRWDNGLEISDSKGTVAVFSEDDVHRCWDILTAKKIIEEGSDQKTELLNAMLVSAGYLTHVKIVKQNHTNNGLQLRIVPQNQRLMEA